MNPILQLWSHLHFGPSQAVLVCNVSNVQYLTNGFSGEGSLLLTADKCFFFTDLRYSAQASAELSTFDVVPLPLGSNLYRMVAGICRKLSIEQLFYEENTLSMLDFSRLYHKLSEETNCVALNGIIEKLRQAKRPEEQDALRTACQKSARAFELALHHVCEGMSELDFAWCIDSQLHQLGVHELAFPTMVAFGSNTARCHHCPNEQTLRTGDAITVDFGAKVQGYCADMTRTFFFGQPNASLIQAYNAVQEALQTAIENAKAGESCGKVDRLVRSHLQQIGHPDVFSHALGHGVGLDVHEAPRFHPTSQDTLTQGCTVALEPGLYLPDLGGVRLEDTVLIRQDSCEVLTNASRDLLIL